MIKLVKMKDFEHSVYPSLCGFLCFGELKEPESDQDK